MGTPLCILLVDDSKFFLELESQFLRNTPASILTANSAKEAYDLAREYRPSLIYMDMDMPQDGGIECCRRFKSDVGLSKIPLVLIGADGSPSDKSAAYAAGADAYLSKPLDRRSFLSVGHSFLVSIDRREKRQVCRVMVEFSCRGRASRGRCIDVSSGGMFLECQPSAKKGEPLLLQFSLPDAQRTAIEVHGRIAWINSRDEIVKEDYPLGYGVEFVDITASVGTLLRRYFGT